MVDETLLVAAMCRSRSAYEQAIRIGVEPTDFGEAAAFIMQCCGKQYGRDVSMASIDETILVAQINRRWGTGSLARTVLDFVATLPDKVSGINIVEEYRLLRLDKISTTLATRLATGQHDDETEALLGRYHLLRNGEEEESQAKLRLEPEDFEDDETARIPVYPGSLNNYIGGGILRGHNITIYGRPDSGKSMLALNNAAGLILHGYRVLYVANEEPAQDITRRLLSRLCSVDITELRDLTNVRQAIDSVRDAYDRWFLFHKASVTAAAIAKLAHKVKPDVIIVDQLKNVAVDDDNRALQLDKLARQVRELGVTYNAATISVTQAGESAQDKLILGMGDIEWSNTGIPGAADLLIGIGVDQDYDKQSKRMLSIPKNKVNGKHGAFPVWVRPERTAFMSKRS
jgi:KaiC/GvpD/RAD55 family RecA-like ATPase